MTVTNNFQKTHKQIRFEEKKSGYEIATLDLAIDWLNSIKAKVPSEALELYASFNVDHTYGYYDTVETELNVRVYYWLPLTEEEIKKKKADAAAISKGKREAAKKRKEQLEARERSEYERLKGKFGISV